MVARERNKPLPVITFELPCCPGCGSASLDPYGTQTHTEADGEVFEVNRYLECRKCGNRFVGSFAKKIPRRGNGA
jgi:hypothetical protein